MKKLEHKKLNEKVNELVNLCKEVNKKAAKGLEFYKEFKEKTANKERCLKAIINAILNDEVIFSKEQFQVLWQQGYFGYWHITNTKERYINTLRKYIDLYGTPLEKDTIMYKAVSENEDLFGCGWTKDRKSAYNFCTKFQLRYIVSMVVPKGTKSIHIHPNFIFAESEDLISTTDVLNETLGNFAELKKCSFLGKEDKVIACGKFELKETGTIYLHKLNKYDSLYLFGIATSCLEQAS